MSFLSISLRFVALPFIFLLGLQLSSCTDKAETVHVEADAEAATRAALIGDWRAVLASPGGELPFHLRIREVAGELRAHALSAGEEAPFSGVEIDGERVVLLVDWYDSEIEARLQADRLIGRFRKTVDDGESILEFRAQRSSGEKPARFLPAVPASAPEQPLAPTELDVTGRWAVTFTDEDGIDPAMAVFQQHGRMLTGTFLTPTGDYRYLEGALDGDLLRLSTFDGAHAFLFQAKITGANAGDSAGETLTGDFWSRDKYHATWTARRMQEDEPTPLPDPYSEVGLTNDQGRFSFSFPDLDGNAVSIDDPRFDGKVVLVDIFGTWCPNCNDSAPVLADLDRRYRDQGLEVVGLAFEMRDDQERNRALVRKFASRHGVEYLLLLAGTSTDKELAGETLSDLTSVLSYPTKIFIDRSGRVRSIHSGFAGPGTGAYYEKLVQELDNAVVELLAESGT